VALGNYYLEGIPDTAVKPDVERAREYFGDPCAQYRLRMYLDGTGGLKEPKQAARWLTLAARKGQYQAQAVLPVSGDMRVTLYQGQWRRLLAAMPELEKFIDDRRHS
jgi:Sel1 repeat